MKKLILLMLVAMVPYFTMAQKRSKKNKNAKTEKVLNADATYEFMVITGVEFSKDRADRSSAELSDIGGRSQTKQLTKAKQLITAVKLIVQFDFGDMASRKNADNTYLMQNARSFTSMAAAVNAAADKGWEFQSANVVIAGDTKVHYYYMRRNK